MQVALFASKLQQVAREAGAALVCISITAANPGYAMLAFKLNPKLEVVLDFGLGEIRQVIDMSKSAANVYTRLGSQD